MRRADPQPSMFRKLFSIGLWILEGAALGAVCCGAILALRAWIWGDMFEQLNRAEIVSVSLSHGARLGAIYFPIARLFLLDGPNEGKATLATCMATIAFGVVGIWFGGPLVPTIAASVGFWGSCGLIYEQRRRERYAAGFNSFFK